MKWVIIMHPSACFGSATFCVPTQEVSDLHTQLEDLFDEVWRDEADWRLNDLIDRAVRSKS
jgi:hypothetical protein